MGCQQFVCVRVYVCVYVCVISALNCHCELPKWSTDLHANKIKKSDESKGFGVNIYIIVVNTSEAVCIRGGYSRVTKTAKPLKISIKTAKTLVNFA